MLTIRNFSFDVDLGAVFDSPKVVKRVTVDHMEITIPPKGDPTPPSTSDPIDVEIREVIAQDLKGWLSCRKSAENRL